jgi:hypothetical protein
MGTTRARPSGGGRTFGGRQTSFAAPGARGFTARHGAGAFSGRFFGGSESRSSFGFRRHGGFYSFSGFGSESIDVDSYFIGEAWDATGGFDPSSLTAFPEPAAGPIDAKSPAPLPPHEPARVKLEGNGRNLRIRVECPSGELPRVPPDGLVARCVSSDAALETVR